MGSEDEHFSGLSTVRCHLFIAGCQMTVTRFNGFQWAKISRRTTVNVLFILCYSHEDVLRLACHCGFIDQCIYTCEIHHTAIAAVQSAEERNGIPSALAYTRLTTTFTPVMNRYVAHILRTLSDRMVHWLRSNSVPHQQKWFMQKSRSPQPLLPQYVAAIRRSH